MTSRSVANRPSWKKPAFVREETTERRCAVASIRRPARLEVVDANLLRRVHVPAGLGEERRNVATRASSAAVEDRLAALRGLGVEAAFWWRGCRDGELVEVEGSELRGDEVGRATHVAEAGPGRHRELERVV